MRVVLQRVSEASVDADGSTLGAIGAGLVVLVGIEARDTMDDVKWLAAKVWNVRLWPNAKGKPWSDSASARNMELLVVSQFTLHARLKGNKPDFHMSLKPAQAEVLYNAFLEEVNRLVPEGGKPVAAGKFGAKMSVKITNDGPVTISIDSQEVGFPRKSRKASPKAATPPASAATDDSSEVDVPWLTLTGETPTEEVIPLEVNADGVYAADMPEGTEMTSIMHALHPDVGPGDITDVPLPSGYSIKIRVPPGKQANDVMQLTIPSALMQPHFRKIQEQRRMASQMVMVPFKVPEGAKPGDDVPVPLPNGAQVAVKIPEGKGPGDLLKIRVPRQAMEPGRVEFTVPEGKKAGDEVELNVGGRQVKVVIPEGKVAGDKLQLQLSAPPQFRLPPNTPRKKITVKVPENAVVGQEVKFALPSGYAFSYKVPEGKAPGDEVELNVPLPLLDPQFRQKQMAQARANYERQQQQQAIQQRGASKPVGKKKNKKKKKK